jgi:hypothetical protein
MKNEFFLARQARSQLDAERARINSLCRTYGARTVEQIYPPLTRWAQ